MIVFGLLTFPFQSLGIFCVFVAIPFFTALLVGRRIGRICAWAVIAILWMLILALSLGTTKVEDINWNDALVGFGFMSPITLAASGAIYVAAVFGSYWHSRRARPRR